MWWGALTPDVTPEADNAAHKATCLTQPEKWLHWDLAIDPAYTFRCGGGGGGGMGISDPMANCPIHNFLSCWCGGELGDNMLWNKLEDTRHSLQAAASSFDHPASHTTLKW